MHGCYWHRHEGCRLASVPKSNQEFWKAKFTANTERDRRNVEELGKAGWVVGIIWECAVRSGQVAEADIPELLSSPYHWQIGLGASSELSVEQLQVDPA